MLGGGGGLLDEGRWSLGDEPLKVILTLVPALLPASWATMMGTASATYSCHLV